jgi:hypothetical protein
MSELPMQGHFRYLSFKTFSMTSRTPQCKVFCSLLLSFEHLGVPEDSQPPTFPSVRLHPHTWPKWGCDTRPKIGGGHHLPLYNILCGRPQSLHPNGFSLMGLPSDSPEIVPNRTPATLEPHNFASRPRIATRSKAKL